MQTLSLEQNEIVATWLQNKGAMLVAASAGSGKTRILTECVRQLIEKAPKERSRILCLTFTNRAAEEMQTRLKDVVGIKDRTFIGTIHAFGLEVLRAYRHELDYSEMPHILEREADRKEILKKVFEESPILNKFLTEISENFKPELQFEERIKQHQILLLNNTLEWISNQKKKLVFIDDEIYEYKNWEEKHLQVFKLYNQYLRNQNLIEFDDILRLAWRIMEKAGIKSIYQRLYKYVLIDESQDLNFAQYELLKSLCIKTEQDNDTKKIIIENILMVGDAKQAIHGYAGADKKFMFENFVNDFNATKKVIEKNYRSSKAVLKTAYKLINKADNDIEQQHYEGHQEIIGFDNETQEAKWVVGKIKELLYRKPEEFDKNVTLDNIAILARNKYVFSELQKILDNDEILNNQYYLKRGSDEIAPESTFMKVFDLCTRIIANEKGEVYWNQLKMILQIKDNLKLNNSGLDSLKNLLNFIDNSIEIISIETYKLIISACEKINKDISQFHNALKIIEEKLFAFSDENERSTVYFDILVWKDAWNVYIRNSSNRTLADFRRFTAMGFNRTNQEKGLTLATVHTMKGLEFEIVFIMGMNNGTFPDYRALRSNGKAMEEEKNNAYVAITRAKRHIYISYPKIKKMPWGEEKKQEASIFLKDLIL